MCTHEQHLIIAYFSSSMFQTKMNYRARRNTKKHKFEIISESRTSWGVMKDSSTRDSDYLPFFFESQVQTSILFPIFLAMR